MEIRVTRDTMSEIYFDALRIRNTVFVKEQGVPYALEVGDPVEEAQAVHFVLYSDDQAVATVRLLMDAEENSGLIQRMAVLKNQRGKGFAGLLIENLLDFAQDKKLVQIKLHAQLLARGFYAKYGFVEVGQIFEEAGIKHITMEKNF